MKTPTPLQTAPVPTEKMSQLDDRSMEEWTVGGLASLRKIRESQSNARVRYSTPVDR